MKLLLTRKVSFIILTAVAALSLAVFSTARQPLTASAHSQQADKPLSGCCADVYTHVATAANTTANWTELDNNSTNGNPNAFVVVTPNRGTGTTFDNHPIGVWYDAMQGRWAIFNQDKAAMPVGAAFNLYALSRYLPNSSQSAAVLDVASSSNSKNNWTYIDNPITNGNPSAFVNVTLAFNPGDKGGVYDSHPLGVWYDTSAQKWAIFNEGSMDAIPNGASFNLLIDTSVINGVFQQTATSSNTSGNHTDIDNTATNNNPAEIVFATPNFNPSTQSGTYDASNIGVYYHNGKWAVFNGDNAAMPLNAAFNIVASNSVRSA